MGLELIKGYLSFVNTGCSYSAVKVLAPTSVAAENFETQLGAGACSHKLLEHWSVPSRKAACKEHGGRPPTGNERNEFAPFVEHATSGWIQHMRVRMWAECLEHPFRGTECEIAIPPGFATPSRRGDVDAIAVDIGSLNNDVAEVNPDTKLDATILGQIGVSLPDPALQLHRTGHRIHHTRKFRENAITC